MEKIYISFFLIPFTYHHVRIGHQRTTDQVPGTVVHCVIILTNIRATRVNLFYKHNNYCNYKKHCGELLLIKPPALQFQQTVTLLGNLDIFIYWIQLSRQSHYLARERPWVQIPLNSHSCLKSLFVSDAKIRLRFKINYT